MLLFDPISCKVVNETFERKMRLERDDDVVITGIGGRYPESNNVDEFWENLMAGVDMATADNRRWEGIGGLPLRSAKVKDIHKMDAEFFKYTKFEANCMEPQIRMLHETTAEALMDAGLNLDQVRGSNTSMHIGNNTFTIAHLLTLSLLSQECAIVRQKTRKERLAVMSCHFDTCMRLKWLMRSTFVATATLWTRHVLRRSRHSSRRTMRSNMDIPIKRL